jgi:sugar/nucleoside kinase (ribokinase family)
MDVTQVVVLGDANVDLLVKLPGEPTNQALNPQHLPPELHGGGTSANVAVGLSRLGIPVALAGALGDDNYGRWVRDDLMVESVNVRGLKMVAEEFTVMVMALIQPDGERLIYVWPPVGGAHLQINPEDINLGLWPQAGWLHTSGICLRGEPARSTILDSMAQARRLGWSVSIDLNLRQESWGLDEGTRQTFQQAIALSDIVFGNAEEEMLPISGASSIEAAAKSISDQKRIVVARLGVQGALVCSPDDIVQSPAFPAEVVDTLGAGDAFNAGFIAAQLMGKNSLDAARWGNAVAALKIERPGARGLPTRAELEAKLRSSP